MGWGAHRLVPVKQLGVQCTGRTNIGPNVALDDDKQVTRAYADSTPS